METLAIAIPEATERRCYRCGVTRPIAMFYVEVERRRQQREGRRTWVAPCRICERERGMARRKPRQDYSDRVKIESGCVDCGIRSPHPEIYDFDHAEGEEKIAGVAALLTKGTMDEFMAEVAKCEVVCANCHRIRTRARGHNAFGKSRR